MSDLQAPTPGDASVDVVRDQDKIMLVLAYFGLLALIPYLTVKDSDYVKWHAKQGLTLMAALFAASIGVTILNVVLLMIPFLRMLTFLTSCVMGVASLGYLVIFVMAIMKAMSGQRWRIPVIADLADRW